MPLSTDFHGTFVANGAQELVMDFLDHADRKITDETSFANLLEKREEVETVILDQIGDTSLMADAGQR